jgi:dienelactone hydrolase
MSQESRRNEITTKKVVYELPGMDTVKIRRDVEYRVTEAGALTFDLYSPPDLKIGERRPTVVFVSGYSDPAAERLLGCKLKDMAAYISWGRLVAASGLVGVTYTNREPVADLDALLQHLRQHDAPLGIDENRLGVWACSGNVPMALSVLMQPPQDAFKCAVLCYGLMLDPEGSLGVAEAAARFGFINPCAGKSVNDLPRELPLFLVRAGQDETPRLNETIDHFVAAALARNLPMTVTNHASAPHAFDILDHSETSREMIRRILAFLRFHLLGKHAPETGRA